MVKLLKIIYFHIYNSYYKNGSYNNDIPHLTAFGLVACSLSFLLFIPIAILFRTTFGNLLPVWLVYSILLSFMILFIYMFLYRRKYEDIYTEIRKSKWDNALMKITSWSIIILAFISFLVFLMIRK